MKRAIVLSAGGSKGAYAVGILKRLFEQNKSYDIIIGSSTGALIAPFVASDNIEKLEYAYTNINHSDIFDINPFKIKINNDGSYDWKINKLAVFYNRYILKQPSFGSTKNLRNITIPNFFTYSDYEKILDSNKDLCVCVSNLTLNIPEVKCIKECTYSTFCDYTWASTCAPPVMSVPTINNYQYTDGGITKPIPITEAIIRGADEIDVIVLNPKYKHIYAKEKITNDTQLQIRTMNLLLDKLCEEDLNLTRLTDFANKNIRINIYYTNTKLTDNSLIFDKNEMRKWLKQGYDYAKNNKQESYIIFGGINKYIKLNKRHSLLRNKKFVFSLD